MSRLLLSVQNAYVTFGDLRLFEGLTFNITEGNKICLVGRNGAGKTTLMNIIKGERDPDEGERWQLAGIKIGYLQQDIKPQAGQKVFDFVFAELKGEDRYLLEYKVDQVLEPLGVDPESLMTELSGGQVRRAALARALVEDPDILLLDEPTNHLDFDVIEWLEGFLRQYHGAVLCISHDKTFLRNISDTVFWLDRGRIRVCPRGFAHFDEWSQMLLEQEERELANREKLVGQEVEWASRGVKARRKRNVRRLELMKEARSRLRADMSAYRRAVSKIELKPLDDIAVSSKVVAEFFNVHKNFGDKIILEKFNYRIMRGDRIGILGKNGSGKTTFLRLLINEMTPDSGKVKIARELQFSYFDQTRRDLEPQQTLWKTLCPDGGDYIDVRGKPRHVCGYLKDFMFDPQAARQLVASLSGGQKNRLILAKILANPGSFLILDEPTNDLDMDTLDMLEEILVHYEGTLVIVSHDRDFLDQTVTQILAFEGDGVVEHNIGGYTDYIEFKRGPGKEEKIVVKAVKKEADKQKPAPTIASVPKMSFKLKHELETLPARMAKLETEIKNYEAQLTDSQLYMKDPQAFDTASRRFTRYKKELEEAETRWLELEEMRVSTEAL